GLAANLAFIVPGLFAPALIGRVLGAQYQVFSTVWIRTVAVVLLGESLLCLPAIAEPDRRPAASWLAVCGGVLRPLFWLAAVTRVGVTPFGAPLAVNGALAVVLSMLLQRGLEPAGRLSGANLGAVAAGFGRAIVLAGRPAALRVVWLF